MEQIPTNEEYEELVSYDDFIREELREVKDHLPFHFLASKNINDKYRYIFKINYRAFPLYAIIDETTHLATVTRTMPDVSGYLLRADASEDDLVFPYLNYCHIISKIFLLVASSECAWIPLLGVSEHARKIVDLDRATFEERVREVLSLKKE